MKALLEEVKILMLPHPLTNFETQKYSQNKPQLNGVYSRNNLPKIMDGTYVINLDKYKSIRTQWIVLYVNDNNGSASCDSTFFDSFKVEPIPKGIIKESKIHRK